jgi:HK97 family phage portal protein
MGIFNKIRKQVANILLKGVSVTPKDPVMGSLFTEWGQEQGTLTDPYKQLSIIYAAISTKARNISQVPFRIYSLANDNEVKSGTLYNLYNTPNPVMSKFDLWAAQVVQMDLHGDAPVIKDENENRGVPVALWPINSNDVKEEVTNTGAFIGYTVKIGGAENLITKDQVILPKYYNPDNLIRGMAPVEALNLDMESEWYAMKYNTVFFENGQTPGAIFSTDQQLNKSQQDQLQEILIRRNQGSGNSHKSMLLHSGMKLASARPSNKDMEFLDMRKFNLDRFLAVLGVPKMEIQMYEDINYATAQSSSLSFWEKTLIPMMRLLEASHNKMLLNDLGYYGKFDVSAIDVLNQRIIEKAEAVKTFWNIGVTMSELNRRFNLGFEELPEGDKSRFELEPQAQQEVKSKTLVLPYEGELEPQKIDISNNKALRDAKWRSITNKIKGSQGEIKQTVRRYFFSIEQKIYKRIAKDFKDAVVKAAGFNESDFLWIEDLFSDQGLRDSLITPYTDVVTLGGPALTAREVENIVNFRFERIIGINETARKEVLGKLKKTLQEAEEQGLSEAETANAIIDSVKGQFDIIKRRATTIARTEAHAMYEQSRFEDVSKTDPPYKMWLDARERVRDMHQIDGEVVKWEEKFSNGLMFPHDPEGAADNVINCRCSFIALYDIEQVEDLGGRLNG